MAARLVLAVYGSYPANDAEALESTWKALSDRSMMFTGKIQGRWSEVRVVKNENTHHGTSKRLWYKLLEIWRVPIDRRFLVVQIRRAYG
jgi:hypothetical protein